MATTIASNRHYKGPLLTLLMLYLCFYVLGAMYLPRILFLELLNGVVTTLGAVVIFIYSLAFKTSCKNGYDGCAMLSAGIIVLACGFMVQAAMRIYYMEFRPEVGGRTFDTLVGLPAFGQIFGQALEILAIGVIDLHRKGGIGQHLRRNIIIVALCFVSGCALIGYIRLIKPLIFDWM